ncbi:hypothetical protein OG422_23465 [Streptomyces sp. NBC_01525]|uniref:hypothetical protein n=1 Tax=Streptomyces sp. NBC_01525 TaxID=2903893 RepID=UPI00386B213B
MAETASPSPSPPARAERFVWLTARVLEQRLFAYHFLGGGDTPVERALAAYRNDDGGYGHALEPELRGPASQPLHTAHALGVLDRIGRCDSRHIEHVCRYLTRISTRDGALPALHPSARGYPVAPWLPVAGDPPSSARAADTPVAPGYAPGEHHFAYDYATAPGALARGWFTDAELARSLDHLASLQRDDGGWPADAYVRAPGTAAESRPVVTLRALLTLRAHGWALD